MVPLEPFCGAGQPDYTYYAADLEMHDLSLPFGSMPTLPQCLCGSAKIFAGKGNIKTEASLVFRRLRE
jgi:hypothetical protein